MLQCTHIPASRLSHRRSGCRMTSPRRGCSRIVSFPAVIALFVVIVAPVRAADATPVDGPLTVSPEQATVSHPRFPQAVLVSRQLADGTWVDLTREAKFASADPRIARVDERGLIWPVAAGQTFVEVSAAGL